MALPADVLLKGGKAVSVAPSRLSGPVLHVLPGGRNRPSQVTVTGEAWDEAIAEIAALRAEGREFVASVMPLVRRLYLCAHEVGPAAEQLVAAVEYRLTRYGRHFDDEPRPAA